MTIIYTGSNFIHLFIGSGSTECAVSGSNTQHQANSSVSPVVPVCINNPNLKTLPEAFTINEFHENSDKNNDITLDAKMRNIVIKDIYIDSNTIKSSGTFCSNSYDDIENDDMDGSVSSLVSHCGGGLSLSNYSLSNLQGSHCSLSRSNFNIYASGTALTNNNATKQRFNTSENLNAKTIGTSQNRFVSKKPSDNNSTSSIYSSNRKYDFKRNLLQRRGSNTSLTLNIVADRHEDGARNHSSLNRFNSHSSLNIIATPFDLPRLSSTGTKKGLLERRNSNTSLTLNIQKRALSTSNCNFRDSNLSLGSISNNYDKSMDETQICSYCGGAGLQALNDNIGNTIRKTFISVDDSKNNQTEEQIAENTNKNDAQFNNSSIPAVHRRKFLSSENLYTRNHSFQLCQTSESIKSNDYTFHGSNIDLNQTNVGGMINAENCSEFNKKCYCQCGNNFIRNVTTKPLSPQATSEDFKIYLANIQMLQSATNALSYAELKKLIYVFERSYIHQNKANSDEITTESEEYQLSETEQNALLTNIHQEFWDLPTNYQEKPLVFGSQIKNRYKTILPNEHSRVILENELIFDKSDSSNQPALSFEPYINANYIKVRYNIYTYGELSKKASNERKHGKNGSGKRIYAKLVEKCPSYKRATK